MALSNCKELLLFSFEKQQKVVDIDDIEFADNRDTIEEQILNQSEAMQIHLLLHNLDEPYKEVFMLRVLEN